jgi:hypothetical protein
MKKGRTLPYSEAAEAAAVLLRAPAVVVVAVNTKTMRWELRAHGTTPGWKVFAGAMSDALYDVLKTLDPPAGLLDDVAAAGGLEVESTPRGDAG